MSLKTLPPSPATHEGTSEAAHTPVVTDSSAPYYGTIDGHIPLSDIGVQVRGSDMDQTTTTGNLGLHQLPPRGEDFVDDVVYTACWLLVVAIVLVAYLLLR